MGKRGKRAIEKLYYSNMKSVAGGFCKTGKNLCRTIQQADGAGGVVGNCQALKELESVN